MHLSDQEYRNIVTSREERAKLRPATQSVSCNTEILARKEKARAEIVNQWRRPLEQNKVF